MTGTHQDALIGRIIAGKYEIVSRVGAGAMGTVYLAKQLALGRRIALKVLRRDHEDDALFAGRFDVEAKAASRLDHPNSTRVLDFGREPDGLHYIAMEYLEGRSLYEVLRDEWPLLPERAVDIVMQALAAIAVAHDIGVLHRDLKPENLMILPSVDDDGAPRDLVKVCDFGIAKLSGTMSLAPPRGRAGRMRAGAPGPCLTDAGSIVGTPEYMSPEQAAGGAVDRRTDLYALGVILYEALCGRPPFEDDVAATLAYKHATQAPISPTALRPDVTPELADICLRALRKDPARRFASAREMRGALRAALATMQERRAASSQVAGARAPRESGSGWRASGAPEPSNAHAPRWLTLGVAALALGFLAVTTQDRPRAGAAAPRPAPAAEAAPAASAPNSAKADAAAPTQDEGTEERRPPRPLW